MSHAKAYEDPGTPQEQSRRTFMANVTLAVGGIIGLVLTVPIVTYLVPSKDVLEASGKAAWPLDADDWSKFKSSADPIKINFKHRVLDAYLPPEDAEDYVWGVKMSAADLEKMKSERKDLLDPHGSAGFDWAAQAAQTGFVLFSSICPHLGCKFQWNAEKKHFLCPCHNSEFLPDGEHVAGPAARGLDPLAFKEESGKAEVTWIRYKPQIADRVIVSFS